MDSQDSFAIVAETKEEMDMKLKLLKLQKSISGYDDNNKHEKCPFENTVNLTDQQQYENGSYVYQGILIPPEKQQLYDYNLKFQRDRETVPQHLRGCICEDRPCMKLCCKVDEYYDDTGNTSKCEKITQEMKVTWQLPIQLKNGTTNVVNLFNHFTTQVGLPCWMPEALDYNIDDWILQEDGILYFATDQSCLDTLNYCYSPRLSDDSSEYILTPFSCQTENLASWQLLLNTYAMAISVLFLIPTILVYLVLKELRENLCGKLLICYLLSLTMAYAIISFISISKLTFDVITCSFLGFTSYFFFMATFLWLSVLCYDIWKNFKGTNVELSPTKNSKQFILYSLYVWLSAGLATFCIIYIQLSPTVDDIYKPGIDGEMCSLDTKKWSAALYFYGPILVILLFNFATFVYMTARIYKVRRNVERITVREKFFQENAIVLLRLFLIMGISWLFDIVSYCMRENEDWDFMFVLSDFANAIQGIFIFLLFVLKPNVWKLLKKRFQKDSANKPRSSVSPSTTTKFIFPTSRRTN
ncbi:G-protein coupled receptor Mth2-like [Calliphora vicina]|uniref:G-protein coupled receptor Mth2-like n=1 Tax=Calliphora vicina TaxID=7373 RepID=UPI00325BA268